MFEAASETSEASAQEALSDVASALVAAPESAWDWDAPWKLVVEREPPAPEHGERRLRLLASDH